MPLQAEQAENFSGDVTPAITTMLPDPLRAGTLTSARGSVFVTGLGVFSHPSSSEIWGTPHTISIYSQLSLDLCTEEGTAQDLGELEHTQRLRDSS